MAKLRTLRAGAACALLVGLTSTAAFAQEEPSAADIAAARALGQEGVKLADSGNCQEAVERLQRAEKLYHAPTTLARLGECQVQLGKIVEGTENLNKVARETLSPTAPAAFAQAQERAKRVLAEARPKIARLKIAVAGAPEAQISVKVDGEPMHLANLNTNRPMDPGDHVIEASAPGYKVATAKVRLGEGGADSVALTLEIDPNAPKNPPPGAQPPPGGHAAQDTRGSSRLPGYIALGVGVVGVGVGTVFGLMATSKQSDLDKACKDKVCPSDQQSNIDSAKTSGTISTVGFIVGGVGLVAGAYLVLTSGGSSKTAQTPSRGIQPFVGLDRAGVSGTF